MKQKKNAATSRIDRGPLFLRSAGYVALLLFLFGFLIPFLWERSGVTILPLPLGALRFTGLVIMITGGAAYAWGAAELAGRAGKTPAQRDRPTALVTTGLFQYSRNPMYLGVILIFLGDLVFFETLVYLFYALGVWGLFHLFVVYYEEPRLGREFGESYRNYTSRVPRWLPFGLLNP